MNRMMAIMVATVLLLPMLAWAEPKGGIELISIAEVEVVQKNDKGVETRKRVSADKTNVVPGDTVIYTTIYTNKGSQPATGVSIKNPIPENMVYVANSAEGPGSLIEFSVNKGKNYGPINKLIVKNAAGKERPATAADISDVRWNMENAVQPKGKGSVSFRAKVK